MLFKKFQSIPANTTAAAPNWQKLKILPGTIVEWIIFFDPKAADLLNIRVVYHNMQLVPFSPDTWLNAFFTSQPFKENIEIKLPPYELDIYAYNLDDTFPHQYFIHPIIIQKKPLKIPETDKEISTFWQQFLEGGE